MATTATFDKGADRVVVRRQTLGRRISGVLTSTDHKVIGNLYLSTTFAFFLIDGVMALVLRAELARPGMLFVDADVYNQLFTIHGTVILPAFASMFFLG